MYMQKINEKDYYNFDVGNWQIRVADDDNEKIHVSELGEDGNVKKSFTCYYGDDINMLISAISHPVAIIVKSARNTILAVGCKTFETAVSMTMEMDSNLLGVSDEDITIIKSTENYCKDFREL